MLESTRQARGPSFRRLGVHESVTCYTKEKLLREYDDMNSEIVWVLACMRVRAGGGEGAEGTRSQA